LDIREIQMAVGKGIAVYYAEVLAKQPALSNNYFAAGDFVFLRLDTPFRKDKLSSRNKGPYKVVSQDIGSDIVHVVDLVTGDAQRFTQAHLYPFFGSLDEAQRMARLDEDQFVITRVAAHKGDVLARSTMYFSVVFEDGDIQWIPFSRDLASTIQFEHYCLDNPPLHLLLVTVEKVNETMRIQKALFQPGLRNAVKFLSLRVWGSDWYEALPLPNVLSSRYVVKCLFTAQNAKRRDYTIFVPLFKVSYTVSNRFLYLNVFERLPVMTCVDDLDQQIRGHTASQPTLGVS
jgi:hypothetical protein